MTGTKSTALPQRTGSSDVTVIGRIKSLLFGGVIGSVSGLLLISVFAIIFAYSSLPDTAIDLFSYGAVAFAAFISGFAALKLIRTDGLVNGLIAGAILFLLHATATLFFGEDGMSRLILFGAIELPFGALGGIISVNLGSKNTRNR